MHEYDKEDKADEAVAADAPLASSGNLYLHFLQHTLGDISFHNVKLRACPSCAVSTLIFHMKMNLILLPSDFTSHPSSSSSSSSSAYICRWWYHQGI